MEQRYHGQLNNPTDKYRYINNYNYNRHNHDDKHVPEEDQDLWYENKYIPWMLS